MSKKILLLIVLFIFCTISSSYAKTFYFENSSSPSRVWEGTTAGFSYPFSACTSCIPEPGSIKSDMDSLNKSIEYGLQCLFVGAIFLPIELPCALVGSVVGCGYGIYKKCTDPDINNVCSFSNQTMIDLEKSRNYEAMISALSKEECFVKLNLSKEEEKSLVDYLLVRNRSKWSVEHQIRNWMIKHNYYAYKAIDFSLPKIFSFDSEDDLDS